MFFVDCLSGQIVQVRVCCRGKKTLAIKLIVQNMAVHSIRVTIISADTRWDNHLENRGVYQILLNGGKAGFGLIFSFLIPSLARMLFR